MRRYCDKCEQETETKVITKAETYTVCGEDIEINANVLVCAECGEELYSEELDNATLLSAYDEYRKRHKLLYPEEIRKIREQYGLSQRGFAMLLNWGDKTICRYENGSIQDKAHNSLLLLLRDPENMRAYLTENETTLSEKRKNELLERIDRLEQNGEYRLDRILSYTGFMIAPCEENGFKAFDFDKFCAMVLFFARKNHELLKTKLMKLLNYSDMIFYKENGISISGTRYVHLTYGPVPENFDFLLGTMTAKHIAHIDVIYDSAYERHQVVPEESVPDGILSEEELDVMERIYEKFKNYGSVEISNYSHNEKGYRVTKQGEIISYAYAKDIELN